MTDRRISRLETDDFGMSVTIHLQKLVVYGDKVLGRPVTLKRIDVSKLAGGFVSGRVYRHDLVFGFGDDSSKTISVVQKYTHEAEVRVMQAISVLTTASAIPHVIDLYVVTSPSDQAGAPWFTTPFYEGKALTFDDTVPAGVIESLAQLHTHFSSRVTQFEGLDGLYRVDGPFFRRTFSNALDALEKLRAEQPYAIRADLHRRLQVASESPVFEAALDILPVTLVHGDVHPGNIIHSPGERPVLIDWGNARIAPAMLDLANVVDIDSVNWATYVRAWEGASGEALDHRMARLGYYWATAMVNLQYMPFAAGHTPENVPEMIVRTLNARDRILEYGV